MGLNLKKEIESNMSVALVIPNEIYLKKITEMEMLACFRVES